MFIVIKLQLKVQHLDFYKQGGPKVGMQLLKHFLYALKLHAVYFMLLVE